jgi:hypothetical protein
MGELMFSESLLFSETSKKKYCRNSVKLYDCPVASRWRDAVSLPRNELSVKMEFLCSTQK